MAETVAAGVAGSVLKVAGKSISKTNRLLLFFPDTDIPEEIKYIRAKASRFQDDISEYQKKRLSFSPAIFIRAGLATRLTRL